MKPWKKYTLLLVAIAAGYLFLKKEKPSNDTVLPKGWKADSVKVDKSTRMLMLCKRGLIYRSFAVALGENPNGHKQCEGDERTPEGTYTLDWRMDKGSCCHKSIHINYPSISDRARAKKCKCSPGGDIMIHGVVNGWDPNGTNLQVDWTNGCIGLSNADMDEVWKYTSNGTPITISP